MSTYVPIQAITLSAAASSVTFTGIPQTYTDLVMVCQNGNTSGSRADIGFRFNSDSGSNYSRTNVFGTGTTAGSGRFSNETAMNLLGFPASGEANTTISHIMNYSNTTTNKTVLNRLNNLGYEVMASAGLWRNTAAITSIEVRIASNTMPSGSTFTLYGVGSGSPKAFGGDEVRTDGTYWYHIYRSSGRFEPVENLSCDYLVVAGGGGGANGGGGAGGYRDGTSFSVAANTVQTVTIGAGGPNGTTSKGGDSTFSTITANGGGPGAINNSSAGGTGGSGGGGYGTGGQTSGGAGNTPSTSPSQGNNGGTGASLAGGGGGGAGGAGTNASSSAGGAGGGGTSSSITGTSVARAGGGGGGGASSGGTATAGGGAGGASGSPSAGTTNTGGGGGGGYATGGANGGSGIIVIRYGV